MRNGARLPEDGPKEQGAARACLRHLGLADHPESQVRRGRGREHAGPFPGGAELWLADGARVRIDRSGSRRNELQEVVVSAGDTAWCIWQRSRPVLAEAEIDANARTFQAQALSTV